MPFSACPNCGATRGTYTKGCALCHRRRSQTRAQHRRRTGHSPPARLPDADRQDLLTAAKSLAREAAAFREQLERTPRRDREQPLLREAQRIAEHAGRVAVKITAALR